MSIIGHPPVCGQVISAGGSMGDEAIYLRKQEAFLKAVSSPGNDPMTVSGTSLTEFALTPPNEEGNGTHAAFRSWEGTFHSVTKFLETAKCQSLPMPAVSVVRTATVSK